LLLRLPKHRIIASANAMSTEISQKFPRGNNGGGIALKADFADACRRAIADGRLGRRDEAIRDSDRTPAVEAPPARAGFSGPRPPHAAPRAPRLRTAPRGRADVQYMNILPGARALPGIMFIL
jgi:hypothetical protein